MAYIAATTSALVATVCLFLVGINYISTHSEDRPDVSNYHDFRPAQWEAAPSSMAAFPVCESGSRRGAFVLDPWNYVDRLAMYKMLLDVTSPAMDRIDRGAEGNFLWGLPIQHHWQFVTGRLEAFGTQEDAERDSRRSDSCCLPRCAPISPTSWWGAMNYYLSVVPFLGAVKAGLFTPPGHPPVDVVFQMPSESVQDACAATDTPESGALCGSIASCEHSAPQAMKHWQEFFEFVKTLLCHSGAKRDHCPSESMATDDVSCLDAPSLVDTVLGHMWTAHVYSIREGGALSNHLLLRMSETEAAFGTAWVSLVDFLAKAYFHTDLSTTTHFQALYLPDRLLGPGDYPPFVANMTGDQNRALFIMQNLSALDERTGGAMLRLWIRAMCSRAGRQRGRHLLARLVSYPLTSVWSAMRLLGGILWDTCDT